MYMHKQVDCASYVHDKLQKHGSSSSSVRSCFSNCAVSTTWRRVLHKSLLDIEATNLDNNRCTWGL